MSQSLLTGFSDTKCSVKWSPPPLCPPPPSSASYIPESCRVESRPAAPPFIHQRLDWSASARPSPHAAMRCCDEVKSPRQVVCAARATCSLPSASFGVLLHLVTGGLLHICFSTLTHSQPGLWPCCLCVCFGGGLGCHSHLPSPLSGVAGLNSWSDNSPLRPICFQSECLPWSLWTSTASIITARSKRFQSLAARPRHSPGVGYTKDACTQTTHKHGFLC